MLCMCICTGGVLPQLWDHAFGKLSTKAAVAFDDPAWTQEVSWHVVASKRVQKGGAFVRAKDTAHLLLLTAILLEPFRWLTGWLLHFSSPMRRARRGGPHRAHVLPCAYHSPLGPRCEHLEFRTQ